MSVGLGGTARCILSPFAWIRSVKTWLQWSCVQKLPATSSYWEGAATASELTQSDPGRTCEVLKNKGTNLSLGISAALTLISAHMSPGLKL